MAMNLSEMLDWLRTSIHEITFGSYLVARGVKPMYLVGVVEFNNVEEMRANKEFLKDIIWHHGLCEVDKNLEITSCKPIPCVVENRKYEAALECALCAQPWVCEMFEWLYKADIPDNIREALTGMLCGYDTVSIEKYVETRVRKPWLPRHMQPKRDDDPEKAAKRADVAAAVMAAREAGQYEVAEHFSESGTWLEETEEGEKTCG